MQLGWYHNFIMESVEIVEMKVMAAEEKAAFIEMLVCEVEKWASEVEQEFRQMKRCHDVVIEEVICSDKKLKKVIEWLASMLKQMIKAYQ